uniref:TIP120 domain-containing protein n=1 Tax=Echinostoma caproni TaxID=27848 RepID=A0A183A4T5_9TREM
LSGQPGTRIHAIRGFFCDAIVIQTTLDVMADDVIAALGNKSPGVRSETALFLSRVFARCNQATLTKKLLKTFTTALCTTSVDTVVDVREHSFAALGTAMRVVGAKNIEPFLADLEPLRMNKIKEYSEQVSAEKSEGASGDVLTISRFSKPDSSDVLVVISYQTKMLEIVCMHSWIVYSVVAHGGSLPAALPRNRPNSYLF